MFQETKPSPVDVPGKYSSLLTRMCDDRFVDDLCSLVGSMASNWGYFESEIIFILTKRLEVYFNSFEINNAHGEFGLFLLNSNQQHSTVLRKLCFQD